ncbi:MAG: amidase [Novosphingobium sp.]|nr:amidase [Novosphingobium sp.]
MEDTATVAPVGPLAPAPASGGLTGLPAWKIADMVAAGELSPVDITEAFLSRIAQLDGEVRAFRTVAADAAREAAREAESAVREGRPLGPLHGVPLALKEHIPVAGCNYWNSFDGSHAIAERDGIEAERLRAAGAILIGTTVAGITAREFGAERGQPENPWDNSRVCGDSSSGCAAAVSAGLVPAAVAVDGLGSTRLPAAFCGLVGLNPTRGRIPWTSWSAINPRLMSNAGPLTTNLRDAALIMSVLAGPDGRDLMSRPDAPPDYFAGLGMGLKGLNLAWSADPFEASERAGAQAAEVIAVVRDAARWLEAGGARLTTISDRLEGAGQAALAILGADRTVASRTEAPPEVVRSAKEGRKQAIDWFNALFERFDVLVTPTIQYVAPTREEWAQAWADPGYMLTYAAHTAASNLTGFPALSVPAGLVQGMPVGVQFWGPPDSEAMLFRIAEAFLNSRVAP